MIKTLIAPVQAWIMAQGRCVACGRELAKQKNNKRKNGEVMVICECGRIFMHDEKANKFRRARLDEV